MRNTYLRAYQDYMDIYDTIYSQFFGFFFFWLIKIKQHFVYHNHFNAFLTCPFILLKIMSLVLVLSREYESIKCLFFKSISRKKDVRISFISVNQFKLSVLCINSTWEALTTELGSYYFA